MNRKGERFLIIIATVLTLLMYVSTAVAGELFSGRVHSSIIPGGYRIRKSTVGLRFATPRVGKTSVSSAVKQDLAYNRAMLKYDAQYARWEMKKTKLEQRMQVRRERDEAKARERREKNFQRARKEAAKHRLEFRGEPSAKEGARETATQPGTRARSERQSVWRRMNNALFGK